MAFSGALMRVGGSKGSRSLAHGMEVTRLGNRSEVILREGPLGRSWC